MKIDVPLPYRVPFTMSIACSSESAWMTVSTGPKISSCATSMSGVTLSRIVGPTKAPSGLAPAWRPSTASVAPASTPFSIMPRMRSRAAVETTGPTWTPFSMPSPTVSALTFGTSASNSGPLASPTATTTEPAMQRWPAAPKADPMMLSAVLSIRASGITIMWFLAPPRACTRLPFSADRR